MKPSRPFVFALTALVMAGAGVALSSPPVHAAPADTLPLTTALTPTMIDYFALGDAFARPSMAALVQCHATPACGASDSSRVRFLDVRGNAVDVYDAKPTSVIEQVRHLQSTLATGASETRTQVRTYTTDDQGKIVMNGVDSIVTVNAASASTLTRVHRYSDVRYLPNDLHFIWPLTGLIVLELSNVVGAEPRGSVPLAAHGAVSFDGSQYAQILSTAALRYRVDLRAKRLETTMPER
jgi:hypothetical protein